MIFRRLPFNLTFGELFEWLYRLALIFIIVGILYLRGIFATIEALAKTDDKVSELQKEAAQISPRIEAIEKRQGAQWTAQKTTEEAIARIQVDMAAMRATQAEAAKSQEKNFDRLFNKVDQLSR